MAARDPEKAADAPIAPCLPVNKYPEGVRLGLIIASLAAAVFLCALDETIIATAIPRITDDFKSINDIGWYGSAYFLTFASFQLIYGKLFTFYPIKTVFISSIAIFEAGSLVCAVAPLSRIFIAGRAIAGLGCAGINAGFIIILAACLPLERRPIFVSSYSAMYGVAAVVAPLLGGAFTTHLTWRWCFYINLPIGAGAMILAALCLQTPRAPQSPSQEAPPPAASWTTNLAEMDLLGTSVLISGMVCLLLALEWGGSVYPWSSAPLIGLLVALGIAAACFVGIQIQKQDKGTVPPRITRQRSVACSAIYVFCAGGALNVFQYFLPIWFQAIRGMTPFASGTRILPTTLGTVVFSFVAGIGVAATGYYTPFMILGGALLAGGAAAVAATWRPSTSDVTLVCYQIVFGAGAGIGVQQAHTAAQTVLADGDVPTGVVVLIFAQILGGTVWLSVGQNVMVGSLVAGLARLPQLDLDARQIVNMGATGFREAVAPELRDAAVLVYSDALMRTFFCAAGLGGVAFCASLGMEWRSIRVKR
ncbi:major facilitator superfamily domain-containing protein [Echria macrotheca]|uniref:Major facilitator superfamily domain-containing protein n=1 Tax=Echria macrotheca TaxID=438768 RepID=A0AAJ0BB63_9PEZI|nr:major facilitator superfamily domain-containing protein [Echria macrotheca]